MKVQIYLNRNFREAGDMLSQQLAAVRVFSKLIQIISACSEWRTSELKLWAHALMKRMKLQIQSPRVYQWAVDYD